MAEKINIEDLMVEAVAAMRGYSPSGPTADDHD